MPNDRSRRRLERLLAATPPPPQVPDVAAYGIYGAGELGQLCFDLLGRIGKSVSGVWDRDPAQCQRFAAFNGLPGDVLEAPKSGPVVVCISKAPYDAVLEELAAKGFSNLINFYDLADLFHSATGFDNGWRLDDPTAGERAGFADLLAGLNDEVSGDHLCEFLHWHRLRRPGGDADFDPDLDNRYFPDFVRRALGDGETFVDIGCHAGSVIHRFHELSGARYHRIVGFEPDPHNMAAAVEAVGGLDARIELIAAGIGPENASVPYEVGLNYCSAAQAGGGHLVSEFTLDHYQLAPTFLKVHIEGREAEALASGDQTIQRARPIIAATVYHERPNLLEVGDYLLNQLTDYRYFFRCHGYLGSGAVLYALPAERG